MQPCSCLLLQSWGFGHYCSLRIHAGTCDTCDASVERIAHNRLTALLSQIYADATIVFPLLVAQTFAKDFHAEKAKEEVQK